MNKMCWFVLLLAVVVTDLLLAWEDSPSLPQWFLSHMPEMFVILGKCYGQWATGFPQFNRGPFVSWAAELCTVIAATTENVSPGQLLWSSGWWASAKPWWPHSQSVTKSSTAQEIPVPGASSSGLLSGLCRTPLSVKSIWLHDCVLKYAVKWIQLKTTRMPSFWERFLFLKKVIYKAGFEYGCTLRLSPRRFKIALLISTLNGYLD